MRETEVFLKIFVFMFKLLYNFLVCQHILSEQHMLYFNIFELVYYKKA